MKSAILALIGIVAAAGPAADPAAAGAAGAAGDDTPKAKTGESCSKNGDCEGGYICVNRNSEGKVGVSKETLCLSSSACDTETVIDG